MDGAARVRATRERTKTGLVNIIVFAVGQSVEDGMTLLVGLGGGDVALLCGSALYSIQAPLIIQKQTARQTIRLRVNDHDGEPVNATSFPVTDSGLVPSFHHLP